MRRSNFALRLQPSLLEELLLQSMSRFFIKSQTVRRSG
jgi:hypothetical protein